jgi:hypothetical protein
LRRFHRTRGWNVSSSSLAWDTEILTPTFLEYWAVRYTLPSPHVHWTGVRLARWQGACQDSRVVVCGLAGALTSDLAPGTVLIPHRVSLADGKEMACDPTLVDAFITAARTLHVPLDTRPLLTSQSLIVGNDRLSWEQRGFIAADMETGLLRGQNLRVATIRVVLDTPAYDLSLNWLHPLGALAQPRLWGQMFWLSWVAPRNALLAAQVLKIGLGAEPACVSPKFR